MVAGAHWSIERKVTSYSCSCSQSVCKCPTVATPYVDQHHLLAVWWFCLTTVDHRKLVNRNTSFWLLLLWLSVPPPLFQSTSRPGRSFLAWGSVSSLLGHPWLEGSSTGNFCLLRFRQFSLAWAVWTLSSLFWNQGSSHLRHIPSC